LFIYSNVSFIGLLNLCSDSVVDTLYEQSLFQAVILAENVVYALKILAENVAYVLLRLAVNFLKPAENQNNYGLGVWVLSTGTIGSHLKRRRWGKERMVREYGFSSFQFSAFYWGESSIGVVKWIATGTIGLMGLGHFPLDISPGKKCK